jgi:hypothetical protein
VIDLPLAMIGDVQIVVESAIALRMSQSQLADRNSQIAGDA